jgi:hypothetical protein
VSEDRATLDLRAEIARIDRDRAEARKLEVEARKLDEERRLYLDRQLAEMRKFNAERDKLVAEALKFERERWWFPWLQLFAAVGGSAVIAAVVSRLVH